MDLVSFSFFFNGKTYVILRLFLKFKNKQKDIKIEKMLAMLA